jgi:hypothetical protein
LREGPRQIRRLDKVAAMGRLAIIVPLREDAHEEALALLQEGPPLDPQAGEVERYWAFLSRSEAVLVFEGTGIDREDGTLWEDLSGWTNGARWERCAESAPRLAHSVHSWRRPAELEGIFFGPLPGPGDSEGGDTVERP